MDLSKLILKVLSFSLVVFILSIQPTLTDAIQINSTQAISTHQQFAALKYEVKETTSLDNPVIDPNFNTLRNRDMNKTQAIILVGGIILIATLAPLITWWYFSR